MEQKRPNTSSTWKVFTKEEKQQNELKQKAQEIAQLINDIQKELQSGHLKVNRSHLTNEIENWVLDSLNEQIVYLRALKRELGEFVAKEAVTIVNI